MAKTKRKHSLATYIRYNNILLANLQKFLDKNREIFPTGAIQNKIENREIFPTNSIQNKITILKEIKSFVEGSNILNDKIPKQLRFTKKIFKKINSALYSKNGLLNELQKGKIENIKKAEEKLANYLELQLKKISLPFKNPNKQIEIEILKFNKEINTNLPNNKIKFAFIFASLCILFFFAGLSPTIAQVEDQPFTKKEKIVNTLETIGSDFHKSVENLVNITKKNSLNKINKKIDVFREEDIKEGKKLKKKELIDELKEDAKDWMIEQEFDKNIYQEITKLSPKSAGKIIKKTIEELCPQYAVKIAHYDSRIDSIFIPIEFKSIKELNKRLYTQKQDKRIVGKGVSADLHETEHVDVGYNRDGNLVICILELVYKNGKFTKQQTNLIIEYNGYFN